MMGVSKQTLDTVSTKFANTIFDEFKRHAPVIIQMDQKLMKTNIFITQMFILVFQMSCRKRQHFPYKTEYRCVFGRGR